MLLWDLQLRVLMAVMLPTSLVETLVDEPSFLDENQFLLTKIFAQTTIGTSKIMKTMR
jgi:hypothetical protein